jgi:hypothetical protein
MSINEKGCPSRSCFYVCAFCEPLLPLPPLIFRMIGPRRGCLSIPARSPTGHGLSSDYVQWREIEGLWDLFVRSGSWPDRRTSSPTQTTRAQMTPKRPRDLNQWAKRRAWKSGLSAAEGAWGWLQDRQSEAQTRVSEAPLYNGSAKYSGKDEGQMARHPHPAFIKTSAGRNPWAKLPEIRN